MVDFLLVLLLLPPPRLTAISPGVWPGPNVWWLWNNKFFTCLGLRHSRGRKYWLSNFGFDLKRLTLFKARAAAEHGISAGQIARNRQTVSNNHATCFAIFKHGKASSERLLAQCRILGPHMHGLKALNLHKLGREAYQLGLWRRRTIAPSGRVEFLWQLSKLREVKRFEDMIFSWGLPLFLFRVIHKLLIND